MIFLIALVALLTIPLSINYQISWQQKMKAQIGLCWLFGLVRVQIPLSTTSGVDKEVSQVAHKKYASKQGIRKQGKVLSALRMDSFRRRVIRFMTDCWRAIKKQDLSLHLRIGLGDPALTGQLWGFVGPISGVLSNVAMASINIEPEFMDSVFEFDSRGYIRIVPLFLIYLVMGLLLSPAFWQGMKTMRASG